jgi:hypothetical protein
MNVSGKKTQDIYDEGASRLQELEATGRSKLKEIADAHLEEIASGEPGWLSRLDERSDELELEVRSYLDMSLERLGSTIKSEGEENERHIARLVSGLEASARKFSETIARLQNSSVDNLRDVLAEGTQMCRQHAERAASELDRCAGQSVEDLNEAGAKSLKDLSQLFDGFRQSMLGEDRDGKGKLFDRFFRSLADL